MEGLKFFLVLFSLGLKQSASRFGGVRRRIGFGGRMLRIGCRLLGLSGSGLSLLGPALHFLRSRVRPLDGVEHLMQFALQLLHLLILCFNLSLLRLHGITQGLHVLL